MDSPTTSLSFTVSGGTDDRESAMGAALSARWRTILGVVVCVLLCMGLSTADVRTPSSIVHDNDWMTPMQKSYSACMDALNLPASIGAPSPDYGTSVTMSMAQTVFARDPYGFPAITAVSDIYTSSILGVQLDSPADISALFNVINLAQGPILVIDGVDYSQAYAHCLDTSGYTAEVARYRSEEAAEYERAAADIVQSDNEERFYSWEFANDQWAACARNQGWLVLESPDPSPEVDIPSSATVSQLQALLKVCPSFDADKARRVNQWAQDHNGSLTDYPNPEDMYDPDIGFQLSPLETPYLSVLFTPEARPFFTHLISLYKVLNEQRMSYMGNSD